MRKQTQREEERSQRLYDALAERSSRDFSSYEGEKVAPMVPGELAFLLEDVLEGAERKLHQDRDEVFAEMIDLGLVEWCCRLEQGECESLGLPFFGEGQSAEAMEATSTRTPRDCASSGTAQHEAEQNALKKELENERRKVRELEEELRALCASTDPEPAKAQDPYGLNGTHAPGYIPLSIHSLQQGPERHGRRGVGGSGR